MSVQRYAVLTLRSTHRAQHPLRHGAPNCRVVAR